MKYEISVEITGARGSQTFIVEADSKLLAIDNLRAGGGDFLQEEIEVMSLNMGSLGVGDVTEFVKPIKQECSRSSQVNAFFRGDKLTGKMKDAVREYVEFLENNP